MSGESLLFFFNQNNCLFFAERGMVTMQRIRELRPTIGTFTVCTIKQLMAITVAIHALVLTKEGAGACVCIYTTT